MRFYAIIAMLTTLAVPVRAQGPLARAGLSQPSHVSSARWESSFRREAASPNQWKKGAAIGAGIGAALGLLLYAWERQVDDKAPGPMVIILPIFISGLVGGMIGSGSHP